MLVRSVSEAGGVLPSRSVSEAESVLRRRNGKKYRRKSRRREVAQMLQLPVGTVTWKNNEALKKLKKELSKEGEE